MQMDRLSSLKTFYSIVVAVLLTFDRNNALNRNIQSVHDFNSWYFKNILKQTVWLQIFDEG